ncbi:secreted salivary gland peptide, putative [Ixodes scapularis]|uniref:Secreted salivary gland peptide, putative n=1 Tax=Ixodes scapularis TaxID=6945 RepID=B7Q5U1_IXOSC|nr:secreted salivary gland peptide, putative [Ixodes scapularis]|eukprot:XP_002402249.1 secreted salivary gland peptide, putative [Ixodes scapularis]
MKSRDYWGDWVFTNFSCVSRWGGRDRRPSDPIRIRFETKDYSGDVYGHQYEIKVLFYNDKIDMFSYDSWRQGKVQTRQLIYMNLTEQCQVTKTFSDKGNPLGCTMWMGYYKVDGNPPKECEEVYTNCGGSTKLKYHDKCKYKPPK